MRLSGSRAIYVIIGAVWAAAVAFGLTRLWNLEAVAGVAARPPLTWPADTRISRPPGQPKLVLLVHPRCPCSRATIAELAKLMTECQGKLSATVLMIRPAGTEEGWERTDIWTSAAAIEGVTVMSDVGGAEAMRFAAATSGQAVLYGAEGRLQFSGGITESRGHQGDNAGRSMIVALAQQGVVQARAIGTTGTPVYGCPLFQDAGTVGNEGIVACQRK